MLSIEDNLPWKVFRRPCYPSMRRSQEKFSHLKKSCDSGKYVFRPHLSATPSDHAFRPCLPTCHSDRRRHASGRTGCTSDSRRCAALSPPIVLSSQLTEKTTNVTTPNRCRVITWIEEVPARQARTLPVRTARRGSVIGTPRESHNICDTPHGRLTIPVHKSHDE